MSDYYNSFDNDFDETDAGVDDFSYDLDNFDVDSANYGEDYDEEYFDNDSSDYPYESYKPQSRGVKNAALNKIAKKLKRFFGKNEIVKIPAGRRGLKWDIMYLYNKRLIRILLFLILVLLLIFIVVSAASCGKNNSKPPEAPVSATVAATTKPYGHKISSVPIVSQDELHAACETYACVMLLKSYGFDIDEFDFVDNYLITRGFSYQDGELYGPDMDAAYAGDVYTGYGINAPAMAKCMNNYIKTTDSKLKAQPLKDVPLANLCKEYIDKDIPVMVWATTYMQEPYVKKTWYIDYTDENSTRAYGDTESWQQNEHCMVLVGYDKDNYYFCDSVAGKVAAYDIAASEKRYKQIGSQAIILK